MKMRTKRKTKKPPRKKLSKNLYDYNMSKLVKLAKLLKAGAPITDQFMHSILDDSLLHSGR
jgi:hypothetical protein